MMRITHVMKTRVYRYLNIALCFCNPTPVVEIVITVEVKLLPLA